MIGKSGVGPLIIAVALVFGPGLSGVHGDVEPVPDWRDVTSVEELWNAYPETIRSVLASLDLRHPGLEPVRSFLTAGDTVAAAEALVEYYKSSGSSEWLRGMTYGFGNPAERQRAEDLLEGVITWRGESVAIPETDHGGWDWTFTGTDPDDEFGYTLNRHLFFFDLLRGWHETGNPAYAETFDRLVRDWIIHNPLPASDDPFWGVHRTTTEELDWRDIGEVVWRDLDAGIRLGESWPQAFFGFQEADEFTPAARLLMLYSITVHTQYLLEHHKENHNWTTMEMNGLSFAGLAFPEYEKSDEWIGYALEVMQREISGGQVYPDGVQMELSTHTHGVALQRFETLVDNFRVAGRSVDEDYVGRIEKMYDYLAYSMRPDGHQPQNNDSDRDDVRPRVLDAAEKYDRSDWTYIATNGERGERPQGLASRVFPWAGLHVMRNGWDKTAHWGFFKTGPYGIGHQHRDKLHLSVHAYGRDLLVDSGRYTHEDYFSFDPKATWRGYFRSSFSQNVVLVDHAGQNVWERIAEEPHVEGQDFVNTAEFDYARGTVSGGYERIGGGTIDGHALHTRAVLYVKGKYWIVVDHVETDRPRALQALWRYAPDIHAVIEGDQVVSNDFGKGNLRIVPAGNILWEAEIIKGQTEPYYQGWYSERYGKKEPNPTAVYSTEIDDDATFAWILVPADGAVPRVRAELVDEQAVGVRVNVEGEQPVSITVPLKAGEPKVEMDVNNSP